MLKHFLWCLGYIITATAIEDKQNSEKVTPGIYLNYKKNNRYIVFKTVKLDDDPNDEFIVFHKIQERRLLNESFDPTMRLMSKKMFTGTVTDAKGNKVPRFQRIVHSKL